MKYIYRFIDFNEGEGGDADFNLIIILFSGKTISDTHSCSKQIISVYVNTYVGGSLNK